MMKAKPTVRVSAFYQPGCLVKTRDVPCSDWVMRMFDTLLSLKEGICHKFNVEFLNASENAGFETVVAQLNRNMSEISAVPVIVNPDRFRSAIYLHPITFARRAFLVNAEAFLGIAQPEDLLKKFGWPNYVALALMLLCSTVTLALIANVSRRTRRLSFAANLNEAFYFMFIDAAKKSIFEEKARLLLAPISFAGIVIMNLYAAALTDSQILQAEFPFLNFHELADGILAGRFVYATSNLNDFNIQQVRSENASWEYRRMNVSLSKFKPEKVEFRYAIRTLLANPSYVYVSDTTRTEELAAKSECQLVSIEDDENEKVFFSFPLRKDQSVLEEEANRLMPFLRATFEMRAQSVRNCYELLKENISSKPKALQNSILEGVEFAIGLCASVIVFVLEVIVYMATKRQSTGSYAVSISKVSSK